jgi:L-glyceraldehyde 3-phosphate reductase
VLRQEGIGCIAFSPLAQGLLSAKYLEGIPADSRAGKPHGFLRPEQITEEKLDKVRRLHQLAERRGQTLAQMALVWVLRLPEVTSALIGVNSIRQLDENWAALKNPSFSETELKEIDAILA